MASRIADLPTKEEFYSKLNDFMAECYGDVIASLPSAGEHRYVGHGGAPVRRPDNGHILRPNSGRLKSSIKKPGGIVINGFSGGRAGHTCIEVNAGSLYDPVNNEHYWSKIAYNVSTDFGNRNPYFRWWYNAGQALLGKLITYASETACYRPSKLSQLGFEEYTVGADSLYSDLAVQATKEGTL